MKNKNNKKKSTFFADFKAFLNRGNVINLAVAVVIGAAFGKIVTALVDKIIMPLLSLALGGSNFSDLKWVIRQADPDLKISEAALGYGAFIQALIDFFIIALCIFIVIRFISRAQNKINELKKKSLTGDNTESGDDTESQAEDNTESQPTLPAQEELLTEIRDLLKVCAITPKPDDTDRN